MGDSDDEYDRKRRDKFQGERTESYRSSERRKEDWVPPREPWSSRQRVRNDYRERYQSYQNEMPPSKRMRYDMDDRRMRYMGDPYGGPNYGPWGADQSQSYVQNSSGRSNDMETQPPIMTFKAFLQTQDDNITDEEAIAKYNEYKQEFRRQQLNEFFVLHKEEEWFKVKYHPEESLKKKEEHLTSLKRRADIFMEMLDSGRVDSVKVDADHGDAVVKLLDAVVIRCEGGTDLDLTILEQAETESAPKPSASSKPEEESKGEEEDKEQESTKESEAKENEEVKEKEESGEEKMKENEFTLDENQTQEKDESVEKKDEPPSGDTPGSPKQSEGEKNGVAPEDDEVVKVSEEDSIPVEDKDGDGDVVPLTPRPLHKTSSIFLRTISPRITKTEIETICKRYPGFLRVSLADPQPEQHWFRRGWVTFRRDVNVKEICWNLNNIRVRDCELGAIVNRDLSRRVRTVSGLSALKPVILHDIKLCAKLIQDLDNRASLWIGGISEGSETDFALPSGNPILRDITDFLVDEASAEEEELLGEGAVTEESKEKANLAVKVLDRLLLYLRIVHSVDFYNQSVYPNEDEMPNRCGIMHLRGTPSSNEVSSEEISEYTEGFRTKLTSLLAPPPLIEESEMASLGAKSKDTEVEKFILANTQELAKDKWLCPLSGKKFKGPEFVRKHIFNKFAQELEEVKKEVDYFNNYLRDPKRPQLAEHPGNRSGKKDPFNEGGGFAPPYQGGFGAFRGRGFGAPHYPSGGYRGGRGGFPRGRPMDYRPVVTYRDLDAPCDTEEVI